MADAIGQRTLYSTCDSDGRVLYGTVTPSRLKKEVSSKNWSSFFSTWKRSKGKQAKVSCTDQTLFQLNNVQLDQYMMNHQFALLHSQPGVVCHSIPVPSTVAHQQQQQQHLPPQQQQQQLPFSASSSLAYHHGHQQVHVNHPGPLLYATGVATGGVSQLVPRANKYSHHTLAPVSNCKKRGNLFAAQWDTLNQPMDPSKCVTVNTSLSPSASGSQDTCTCSGNHNCGKGSNVYLSRYAVPNTAPLPYNLTSGGKKSPDSHKYYSTLGGGFMRSLKRSSDRKSILTSDATAYDLISQQCIGHVDTDNEPLSGGNYYTSDQDTGKAGDLLNKSSINSVQLSVSDTTNNRLIPHTSTGTRIRNKSTVTTGGVSRSRGGTVSKNNVRIAGQGVTLHSWEDTFLPSKLIATGNKNISSSSSAAAASSPSSSSPSTGAGEASVLDSTSADCLKFAPVKRKELTGEISPSLQGKRGSNCQSTASWGQLPQPGTPSYEKKILFNNSTSSSSSAGGNNSNITCHQLNGKDNLCEKLLVHLPEPDYDMSTSGSSSDDDAPLEFDASGDLNNANYSEYKMKKVHQQQQQQKHTKSSVHSKRAVRQTSTEYSHNSKEATDIYDKSTCHSDETSRLRGDNVNKAGHLQTFKSILKNVNVNDNDNSKISSPPSPPPPPPPPSSNQMSSVNPPYASDKVTSSANVKTRLSKLNKYSKHHRKYVTFCTEDKRILDHMTNEPIPEEDETLYDDVLDTDGSNDSLKHFDSSHVNVNCDDDTEKEGQPPSTHEVITSALDNVNDGIINESSQCKSQFLSKKSDHSTEKMSENSLESSGALESLVNGAFSSYSGIHSTGEEYAGQRKSLLNEETAKQGYTAPSDLTRPPHAISPHDKGSQECQSKDKHANDTANVCDDEIKSKHRQLKVKAAPIVPPRSADSRLSGSPLSPSPVLSDDRSIGTPTVDTFTPVDSPDELTTCDKRRKLSESTLSPVERNHSKKHEESSITSHQGINNAGKSDSSTCEYEVKSKLSMHDSKFRNVNKCQCSDKNDTQCQSTHQLLSSGGSENDAKKVSYVDADDIQSDKYDSLGEEINSDDEITDACTPYAYSEAVDGESDQIHTLESLDDDADEEGESEDYNVDDRSHTNAAMIGNSDSSILRNGNKLKISLHYSTETSCSSETSRVTSNVASKLFQKNRHTINRRIGSSHVLQPIYKSSASSTSKSNKIIIDVPGSTSNYLNVTSSTKSVGHTNSPYIASISSSSSTVSSASSSSGYQGNTFDPYDCSSGSGHEEHIYEELYHIDNIDDLTNDTLSPLKGLVDVSPHGSLQATQQRINENNLSASATANSVNKCLDIKKIDESSNLNFSLKSTSSPRSSKCHSYTNQMIKSMFDGASKDEILEYIEDAKERVKIMSTASPLSASSVSSLHLTTFTNSLDRAFYTDSVSEEYLNSLTPLVGNQNNYLSSVSAVNLSSGVNSSTISSTSSGNSASSSGNSSNSSPYTRTKSTPCIVTAVASSSLLPSLVSNIIHSSSGSSIAGGDSPLVKGKRTKNDNVPVTAPPRRNRSSNVSNSSTDSAVTTGSSTYDHDIDNNYCQGQLILSPPVQFTTSSIDSEANNLARSISLSHLIERQDSGVGPETCKPNRLRRAMSGQSNLNPFRCVDCDEVSSSSPVTLDQVQLGLCVACEKKRTERKEIISEFVDTEFKYGRDLRIIKEEFYRPIEVAGLMTKEQLKSVFINLDQLICVNGRFAHSLEDSLDTAFESGDEDYTSINLGKVFMEEASTMLGAFEIYCCNQGSASLILTQLEKEKELLRIFLKVSQMENPLLRRMNLSAFLMVPVQRVTKYPLLLSRLLKVTPVHHVDFDLLKQSQEKVEWHLDHINQQTKSTAQNKIWKRISNLSVSQRRLTTIDNNSNIKLRKIALDAMKWSRDEASFVLSGKLLYTAHSDSMTSRKGRTSKFISVHALLVILGKPTEYYRPDLINSPDSCDHELFHLSRNKTGISDAALVLIREKNSRYTLSREPFDLKKCIVSVAAESEEEAFEIQELTAKDFFLFKAEMNGLTCQWFKQLSYHAKDLGAWRQRRNALPNIMMASR